MSMLCKLATSEELVDSLQAKWIGASPSQLDSVCTRIVEVKR